MKAWIIIISGFTQKLGMDTGSVQLWEKMRAYSAPDVCVQLRVWNDNWRDFAAFVAANSAPRARILVCAYSWGVGHGFIRFSRALEERGRRIRSAVLADPVYRSRLRMARWLALTDIGTIRVPANVDEVRWFRQGLDRPRAHDVAARDEDATTVHQPIWLDLPHRLMDRAPEYHATALAEAGALVDGGIYA